MGSDADEVAAGKKREQMIQRKTQRIDSVPGATDSVFMSSVGAAIRPEEGSTFGMSTLFKLIPVAATVGAAHWTGTPARCCD